MSIVRTLSCVCMALLRVRRACLRVCRALLRVCRALLRLYRPLWSVCRALLEKWINGRTCTALLSVFIELI